MADTEMQGGRLTAEQARLVEEAAASGVPLTEAAERLFADVARGAQVLGAWLEQQTGVIAAALAALADLPGRLSAETQASNVVAALMAAASARPRAEEARAELDELAARNWRLDDLGTQVSLWIAEQDRAHPGVAHSVAAHLAILEDCDGLIREQAELDHEVVAPEDSAVRVLVDALDNLGARFHRDLNPESESAAVATDPEMADVLTKFSTYADQQLQALDHPAVLAALTEKVSAADRCPDCRCDPAECARGVHHRCTACAHGCSREECPPCDRMQEQQNREYALRDLIAAADEMLTAGRATGWVWEPRLGAWEERIEQARGWLTRTAEEGR